MVSFTNHQNKAASVFEITNLLKYSSQHILSFNYFSFIIITWPINKKGTRFRMPLECVCLYRKALMRQF